MTDTTVETTEVETTEVVEVTEPATDLSAEVEKWKALARKNEQRAKENADKAKRFDEFEESQKSELERLQERLAQAEKVAADAEAARLRASIAAKHGVPEALLSGADEAALEQSAQDLLAFKGTTPAAPASDGQGKRGEPVNDDGAQQITREELKSMSPKQIEEARLSGRLNKILGITT